MYNRSSVPLLICLGLVLAAVYFAYDPARHPFPRCPFNLLTGMYCFGCGSQRATHALLHGQLERAANFNLLAVLCLPLLAVGALDGLRSFFSGRPRQTALLYQPWLGWLVVTVGAVFTVLRNLPGPLGNWLAP